MIEQGKKIQREAYQDLLRYGALIAIYNKRHEEEKKKKLLSSGSKIARAEQREKIRAQKALERAELLAQIQKEEDEALAQIEDDDEELAQLYKKLELAK